MYRFYRQLSRKCCRTFNVTPQKSFATQIPPPPRANAAAEAAQKRNLKSTLYYVTAGGVLIVGLSYAAVPLYRMFCQVTHKLHLVK